MHGLYTPRVNLQHQGHDLISASRQSISDKKQGCQRSLISDKKEHDEIIRTNEVSQYGSTLTIILLSTGILVQGNIQVSHSSVQTSKTHPESMNSPALVVFIRDVTEIYISSLSGKDSHNIWLQKGYGDHMNQWSAF